MNPLCPPLLRDAGRLDILELEPAQAVRPQQSTAPARVVRRALEKVALRHRVACLNQLEDDWRNLSCAKRDAATLTSLIRVMALVPSAEGRGPCSVPRFGGGRDVRPWLADREVLRGWLVEMRHLWTPAVAPLVKQRLLPASAASHAPADDGSFCPDVFLLSRFRLRVDMHAGAFDPRFARGLLAFVSGSIALKELRSMETLFLGLPVLLQENAGLCRLSEHGTAGLRWLELLPRDRPAEAQLLLEMILQMDACKHMPPAGSRRLIATVMHTSTSKNLAARMRWVIEGLLKGATVGCLAGTMRLALRSNVPLPDVEKSEQQPSAQRIAAFCEKWKLEDRTCWNLWRAANRYPGVWEMLKCISPKNWDRITASKLWHWVALFGRENGKFMPARWALLRAHWREILELAWHGKKLWRRQVIDLLQYGFHSLRADRDSQIGEDTLLWIRALRDAQTIDPALRGDLLFRLLPLFTSKQRQRIADHLTRLLSASKKVDRSYYFADDMRVGAGWIPLIGRRACLFLLLREPRAFLKALRMLGLLNFEAGERVASVFAEHPLVTSESGACSLGELAVMVESASLGRKHGVAIKERLRMHLAGIKTQPPHLVAADQVDLIQGWARLAIEVLEELIQRELALMFPVLVRNGTSEDTILFLHTLGKDKRKGRSLVRRQLGGLPPAKVHHPANRRWLSALPAQVATLWLGGLTWTRELAKVGPVTLRLEQDPLEILRMGDYGRSCLGAGGCYQHAAVTNAMEANKQVVYARDQSGRVIGRQLLAISEEKRLVCFSVYPLDTSEEMDALFAEYDRAFAEALGLPLEASQEYTMAAPLGLEWYDDGIWRLPTADAAEG
ncbi:MAG TPA: hypothetical protein VLE43_13610 [Candidatus Saccharimonadia bacterium]|nr:hypothetical protein [Candidatus Saccharimonadia bacterium]